MTDLRTSDAAECFFYVVSCNDGGLYAGVSTDPARRLEEHLNGRGAKYMRPKCRRPAIIIYRELCASRGVALRREYWFKQLSKSEKLKIISET